MAADSVSLGYLTVADTLSQRAESLMKEAPAEALSRLQEARGAAATAIAAAVAHAARHRGAERARRPPPTRAATGRTRSGCSIRRRRWPSAPPRG